MSQVLSVAIEVADGTTGANYIRLMSTESIIPVIPDMTDVTDITALTHSLLDRILEDLTAKAHSQIDQMDTFLKDVNDASSQ